MSNLTFDQQITIQITVAGITILGVIIGFFGNFLLTLLNTKKNRDLEILKIDRTKQIEAFQNLLYLSRSLINRCKLENEARYYEFIDVMNTIYTDQCFLNIVYYSADVGNLLEKMEDVFVKMPSFEAGTRVKFVDEVVDYVDGELEGMQNCCFH